VTLQISLAVFTRVNAQFIHIYIRVHVGYQFRVANVPAR
jgi:hypothetical protein